MIYWNLKTCLILRVMMQEVLMEIAESAEEMMRNGQKILHSVNKMKGSGMNQRGGHPRGGGYRGMNYRDNGNGGGSGNYGGSEMNHRWDMFDDGYDPRFM